MKITKKDLTSMILKELETILKEQDEVPGVPGEVEAELGDEPVSTELDTAVAAWMDHCKATHRDRNHPEFSDGPAEDECQLEMEHLVDFSGEEYRLKDGVQMEQIHAFLAEKGVPSQSLSLEPTPEEEEAGTSLPDRGVRFSIQEGISAQLKWRRGVHPVASNKKHWT